MGYAREARPLARQSMRGRARCSCYSRCTRLPQGRHAGYNASSQVSNKGESYPLRCPLEAGVLARGEVSRVHVIYGRRQRWACDGGRGYVFCMYRQFRLFDKGLFYQRLVWRFLGPSRQARGATSGPPRRGPCRCRRSYSVV